MLSALALSIREIVGNIFFLPLLISHNCLCGTEEGQKQGCDEGAAGGSLEARLSISPHGFEGERERERSSKGKHEKGTEDREKIVIFSVRADGLDRDSVILSPSRHLFFQPPREAPRPAATSSSYDAKWPRGDSNRNEFF